MTGDRDPGYGLTARILGQVGVSLARDTEKKDTAGGFWTPATLFGDSLLLRLQEKAGMAFDVVE